MIYNCCNENRKAAVLKSAGLNGIDFLEVLDHDAIALNSPRQQTLLVHCLKAVSTGLSINNVLIQGGESITNITIAWVAPASEPPPLANPLEKAYFQALSDAANVLVVRTNQAGDFSPLRTEARQQCYPGPSGPFRTHRSSDRFRSPVGQRGILLQGGMRSQFRLRSSHA